jgi:hypothetical protein
MDAKLANNPVDIKDRTRTERTSDRELVVTRIFNGPVHLVFKA